MYQYGLKSAERCTIERLFITGIQRQVIKVFSKKKLVDNKIFVDSELKYPLHQFRQLIIFSRCPQQQNVASCFDFVSLLFFPVSATRECS